MARFPGELLRGDGGGNSDVVSLEVIDDAALLSN